MACFYCAGATVNSDDVGPCQGKCAQHVCVVGTATRPNDYHADRCNCGCAKLICIYDMEEHIAREHTHSAPSNCFPNSAAHAGLAAGDAIERSGEFDESTSQIQKEARGRSIYRFLEIVAVPGPVVPKRIGPRLDEQGVAAGVFEPYEDWERIAAALAPHVILTIAHAWPNVTNGALKYRVDSGFQNRIGKFLGSGYAESENLPDGGAPQEMLQAWFDFSPRLTALILQHGVQKKGMVAATFVRGLPGFGTSAKEHWSAYRRTLTLRELVLAGASAGGAASGQQKNV